MKIAIVIPNTGLMRTETAICFGSMCLYSNKTFKSITMVAPQGRVEQNRNMGAQVALDNDCEYLMFIDADMTFPMNAATRLLQHNKDIIGCNAAKRVSGEPVLTQDITGGPLESAVSEVGSVPFAVALIKTEVFKMIPEPWFYSPVMKDGTVPDCALNFCADARSHEFKSHCDNELSKEIGHIASITRFL